MNRIQQFACWVALCGAGFLLASMPPAAAQEPAPLQPPAVTGQYVPPGATAVITLHPRAYFSQRSMRLMPLEMIRVTGEQQFGVDPLQIEQLKVVLGEIGPTGPTLGAVITMAPPEKVLGIGDVWVRVEEPMTIDDKDFYPMEGTPNFVFHVTDAESPDTALVGTRPFLQQMLKSSGDEPPLAPLLEQLPRRRPRRNVRRLRTADPVLARAGKVVAHDDPRGQRHDYRCYRSLRLVLTQQAIFPSAFTSAYSHRSQE